MFRGLGNAGALGNKWGSTHFAGSGGCTLSNNTLRNKNSNVPSAHCTRAVYTQHKEEDMSPSPWIRVGGGGEESGALHTQGVWKRTRMGETRHS